jgi:hypothetical protein
MKQRQALQSFNPIRVDRMPLERASTEEPKGETSEGLKRETRWKFTKRLLCRMLDREPRSWPALQCGIPREIKYEPRTRRGTVYMDSGMCTDARGAIDLFTALDPDVFTIVSIDGKEPDTIYQRNLTTGAWKSFRCVTDGGYATSS